MLTAALPQAALLTAGKDIGTPYGDIWENICGGGGKEKSREREGYNIHLQFCISKQYIWGCFSMFGRVLHPNLVYFGPVSENSHMALQPWINGCQVKFAFIHIFMCILLQDPQVNIDTCRCSQLCSSLTRKSDCCLLRCLRNKVNHLKYLTPVKCQLISTI